jgi:rare lipoprotein A
MRTAIHANSKSVTQGSLHLAAVFVLLLAFSFTGGCALMQISDHHEGLTQGGVASWYGEQFHGLPTASGERFDMHDLTAAHRTLAFGTQVRIKNLANGREVVVRINDRGPFVAGRIIDLSYAAASKLKMMKQGLAKVELTVLESGEVELYGDATPSSTR